ncbi:hypothetical protein NIES4101_52230 [Calothrix sp. NIES-4101]|nr:hypothetical protein NIES4101_52230 [Calothrix sp. NIES-4101]
MKTDFANFGNINQWTEWHLTPRGWERGNKNHEDSPLVIKLEPPIDRILTCRYHENFSNNSVWMKSHISEVWTISDQQILDQMLDKFGSCPQSL